jgi:hypothetical protein
MNLVINRPEQCPYRSPGCRDTLCNHPAGNSPLYCDTSASAVGKDKFPLNCPLRENEPTKEYNNAIRYM